MRGGDRVPVLLGVPGPEAHLNGFPSALARLGLAVAGHPWRALPAVTRLGANLATAAAATARVALGGPAVPVVSPNGRDRRFTDPAWQQSPAFFGMGQAYLAWSRFMHDLAEHAGLEERVAHKASFAVGTVVDALAPSNFLPTNPAALRRAWQTRGVSVLHGARNFFDDVAENGGRPQQVDRSAFEVGKDLAASPGKVIFRDELMELIQYAPQTETVFEVPLLLSPPWINKYYIMDLAPGRSFVEWAVTRGHTVFTISYRNPDESMRDVSLDDYLGGLRTAVELVGEVTGSELLNVAGLCVGGTLAVMLLAHLAQEGDRRIGSVTLLNTLVDFSEPGSLGAFTDEKSVRQLERRMARQGFVEDTEMAETFDALRPNDLIWNYVASNWLMGEPAPVFDILAWNADSTRVSEATHSFYLRSCYLENQLAQDRMIVAGRQLRLGDIGADAYVLAASEDHITPWTSSYMTTQLLQSAVRFVLSSAGHIAGIVNPPSPKRHYWTSEDLPAEPKEWLAGAEKHTGSWWDDWARWIEARAGSRRPPPPIGTTGHPSLVDAPGTYVFSGT